MGGSVGWSAGGWVMGQRTPEAERMSPRCPKSRQGQAGKNPFVGLCPFASSAGAHGWIRATQLDRPGYCKQRDTQSEQGSRASASKWVVLRRGCVSAWLARQSNRAQLRRKDRAPSELEGRATLAVRIRARCVWLNFAGSVLSRAVCAGALGPGRGNCPCAPTISIQPRDL